jgi:ABC-type glycerol-3-phosphate transport system permease component
MKIHGFFRILKILLIISVSVISVFPFYLMLVMSTRSTSEIMRSLSLIPGSHLLENIMKIINPGFFIAYRNSLTISLCATVFSITISSMAGYSIAAYNFPLKNVFYNFILVTMAVPGSIGMVGYLNEMRVLGLTRTLSPMVLIWLANGFGAFWMTQYLKSAFQISLAESARIDGCGEFGIFFRIVIPCIRPALLTLFLMVFLWSWNNYMLPLVIVNSSRNITIPLYIQSLGTSFREDFGARISGLVLSIMPVIVIFAIASKSFIQGLMAGAIKE